MRARICSGHLAAVEAGAFAEGSADAGVVQIVFVGVEGIGDVLRAEDLGVVGEAVVGVGAVVGT